MCSFSEHFPDAPRPLALTVKINVVVRKLHKTLCQNHEVLVPFLSKAYVKTIRHIQLDPGSGSVTEAEKLHLEKIVKIMMQMLWVLPFPKDMLFYKILFKYCYSHFFKGFFKVKLYWQSSHWIWSIISFHNTCHSGTVITMTFNISPMHRIMEIHERIHQNVHKQL